MTISTKKTGLSRPIVVLYVVEEREVERKEALEEQMTPLLCCEAACHESGMVMSLGYSLLHANLMSQRSLRDRRQQQ